MIETKHLEEFLDNNIHGRDFSYSMTEIREYQAEIIKRLRAYDRICRDLKLMIAKLGPDLSNRVDLT